MVPLQGSMALLERGKLLDQFREIVRPPAVGQAGPLARYGGRARHACIVGVRFPVSKHILSLSQVVWGIGEISPIGRYSSAGGIEIAGLAVWGI